MTNYNKLISMSIDELAEWLYKHSSFDDVPWSTWFDYTYCANCEAIKVTKEDSKELLGFQLMYGDGCECSYCEIHNKCKYFPDKEDVLDNKEIIKLWLESEK